MTTNTTTKKTTSRTRKTPAKTTPQSEVNKKLPANPFIHEVFELVVKQKTKQDKVNILKEYSDPSVKAILIWNFDDSVKSAIPEGTVPYKENEVPIGTDHTSLRREYRNLYHFIKGGNDSLSSLRRETMFIQMLEGLHPKEAEIICLVKDKNLNQKYKISFDIVKEAYPDIQWGNRS